MKYRANDSSNLYSGAKISFNNFVKAIFLSRTIFFGREEKLRAE
jgi:hypothetical protein